ncbi:putative amino-acid ABC transporter-binding protein precursor, partial [Haemophilus influenzae]
MVFIITLRQTQHKEEK